MKPIIYKGPLDVSPAVRLPNFGSRLSLPKGKTCELPDEVADCLLAASPDFALASDKSTDKATAKAAGPDPDTKETTP